MQSSDNRYLRLLSKLWQHFKVQTAGFKMITLLILVFTVIFMLIFYSGIIIWKLFSMIMLKGVLHCLELYLNFLDAKKDIQPTD